MNQRRFGKTNLTVSEVALGALEMGAKYGIGEECGVVPPEEEAISMLSGAMEAGITLFDTAGAYGLSEHRIGKFLKTTRQRPVITTKLSVSKTPDGAFLDYACERPYPTVRASVDHQVERSLRNLGVPAIDVMQLHGMPGDDLFEEMTAALEANVRAGRIRFLGASCGGSDIPRLAGAGCYSTVQLRYNALHQDERTSGHLNLAQKHDLGVLLRVPLALGVLADKVERLDAERQARFAPFLNELRARLPKGMTVPEAALRFTLSSKAVTAPLCGTRRLKHVQENARAGDGKGLPADVLEWLYGLADRGELPLWSWSEHCEKDWPKNSHPPNLEMCRSVDF